MPWNDVVGQDRAEAALRAAVASGRVTHAYLLHGDQGAGTLAAALAFGESLLCAAPRDGGACGVCDACARTTRLVHPDLQVYLPFPRTSKGANKDDRPGDYTDRLAMLAEDPYRVADYRRLAKIGDEEGSPKQAEHRRLPVEETVRRDMTMHAVEGGRRVGVLPDVDHMRREAANSFLKLLEEPGPGVVLILTAERLDNVLPTILSRCQRVRFDALPAATVEAALVARGSDAPTAAFTARMAEGSLTRALQLQNSEELGEARGLVVKYVRAAYACRPTELGPLVEQAAKMSRPALIRWLGYVQGWVRDLVLLRATADGAAVVNVDQAETLAKFVAGVPAADLGAMADAVADAAGLIEGNANATLTLTTLAYSLQAAMHGQGAPLLPALDG